MGIGCAADGVVHLSGGTSMYEVWKMILKVKFFGESLTAVIVEGNEERRMLPLRPDSLDVFAFLVLESRPQEKNGIRYCGGRLYSPVSRLEVFNNFWFSSGKTLVEASKMTRLLLDEIDYVFGFTSGNHVLFGFSTEGFYPKVKITTDMDDYHRISARAKTGDPIALLEQIFMFKQIQEVGFLTSNRSRWAVRQREILNLEAAKAIVAFVSQLEESDEMWDQLREEAYRLNPRLRV